MFTAFSAVESGAAEARCRWFDPGLIRPKPPSLLASVNWYQNRLGGETGSYLHLRRWRYLEGGGASF